MPVEKSSSFRSSRIYHWFARDPRDPDWERPWISALSTEAGRCPLTNQHEEPAWNIATESQPSLPAFHFITHQHDFEHLPSVDKDMGKSSIDLGSHQLESLKDAKQGRSAWIDHKRARSCRGWGEHKPSCPILRHRKNESTGQPNSKCLGRGFSCCRAALPWPRPILGNQDEIEARWHTGSGGQTWSWVSISGPGSVQLHFWKRTFSHKGPGVTLTGRRSDLVITRSACSAFLAPSLDFTPYGGSKQRSLLNIPTSRRWGFHLFDGDSIHIRKWFAKLNPGSAREALRTVPDT